MSKIIRFNCFETNSSSTHSLSLSDEMLSNKQFSKINFKKLFSINLDLFFEEDVFLEKFEDKFKHLIEMCVYYSMEDIREECEKLNSKNSYLCFEDYSVEKLLNEVNSSIYIKNLKEVLLDILSENNLNEFKDQQKHLRLINHISRDFMLEIDEYENRTEYVVKDLLLDKEKLKHFLTTKSTLSIRSH